METYWGRARHYFDTTNPLNLLASSQRLQDCQLLLERHREGHCKVDDVEEVEDLWRAKTLCQSAFHPDTGEMMILPGRMAAQVSLLWKEQESDRVCV